MDSPRFHCHSAPSAAAWGGAPRVRGRGRIGRQRLCQPLAVGLAHPDEAIVAQKLLHLGDLLPCVPHFGPEAGCFSAHLCGAVRVATAAAGRLLCWRLLLGLALQLLLCSFELCGEHACMTGTSVKSSVKFQSDAAVLLAKKRRQVLFGKTRLSLDRFVLP